MLDEVKNLQNNAVSKLVELVDSKNEITFKAPTGSGKTHMMADFMDRILSVKSDVVFIVSSLSKAELAKQNYDAFVQYIEDGKFSNLNPYLITSDNASEGSLFIPTDYNVYVLPRDLYKDKSKLKDDATLLKFLNEIKGLGAVSRAGKDIYVIKDECHIATTNLDELQKTFFSKVINFSATPKLSRGQYPDVEIKESDAVAAHLIKKVEYNDTGTLEDALKKFVTIKKAYLEKSVNVNPCMIIQISNKDKADEEVAKIKTLFNQEGFSSLKWMLILDKNGGTSKGSDTNDIIGAKKQPLNKWKEIAKRDQSTIDIIIFKMVITEGWDIRRACMLYQIRDSKSKQLDEQVIGRVRRNPRLLDFEKLDKEAQDLISTAYVWGVKEQSKESTQLTILFGNEIDNEIQKEVKIQTTRLKAFETAKTIDIDKMKNLMPIDNLTPPSIFNLYHSLQKTTNEVREHYESYVDSYDKFFVFTNNIDAIKKEINKTCCDYDTYMEVTTDESGKVCEASFPYKSSYSPTKENRNIDDWVWKRDVDDDEFCFDSDSEKEWAKKLLDLQKKGFIKTVSINNEDILLVGKNFLENSEIKYEYYNAGRHFSYPDFVMKDHNDRIHIFEVKSVNVSGGLNIDNEEYKKKVMILKDLYIAVSKNTSHYYYLPIKKDNMWTIWRMKDGACENLSFDDFVKSLK
jgi:type III restriction enzyme